MTTDGALFPAERNGRGEPDEPDTGRRLGVWLVLGLATLIAVALLVVWGTDVFASQPGGGCGGG